MKKLALIVAVVAVAAFAAACSPEAQQKVQEGLQTAAPTLQAAAQSAGTQVSAGLQTAAPTIQAAAQSAGTQVVAGIQTAAPTLGAITEQLGSTMDKVVALATVWEWQGTKMSDGTELTPEDPTAYTLNFMIDGKVAVKADCNTSTGTYTVDGETLTITLGATTLAMCPEGSLSEDYMRNLSQVGGAMVEGDNLVLMLQMDSGSMMFAPAK